MVAAERLEREWRRLLIVGSLGLVGIATAIQFALEPYRIHEDSALFQHAGWYILQGATPYVDFWDLKPPMIYGLTTVLAALSLGDMHRLHLLSIGVAVLSVVGGVTLVGLLVYRVTGDETASVIGGATMFVVPAVYAFPVAGIRPKYLALFFGTAALLLAVDERPALGGAAAAVATGFWQLGAPIALLVLGLAWQHGGRRGLATAVGGGVAVILAVVAPFVVSGLTIPLFLETVLGPLYGVERYTLLGRLLRLVIEIGPVIALIPVAAGAWVLAVRDEWRRYWWVAAGGTMYLGQIFLELQGAIELVFLVMFLAVGVGILAARLPRQWPVAALVLVIAAGGLAWGSGGVPPKPAVEAAYEEEAIPAYQPLPDDPAVIDSMETIYWEQREPQYCHYRLGHKQKAYAERVGESLTVERCGQWPFEEPPREWVLESLPVLDTDVWYSKTHTLEH